MDQNLELKTCNQCHTKKPLSEFYKQEKFSKEKGDYVYYNPKCKECCISNSYKWLKDNPEKFKKSYTKHDNKPEVKEKKKVFNKRRRISGKETEWRRNNKEKVKFYREERMHKEHNISQLEWYKCREYFNFCCAYCGMSEDEAKSNYNNYLHKEHVEHDGANDLSNCVPACKSCNSSKHDFRLEDWYSPINEDFTLQRLERIQEWLSKSYLVYIELPI